MNQENKQIEDGGSVYPTPININYNGLCWAEEEIPLSPGLSLRDYFAQRLLPIAWEKLDVGELGYQGIAEHVWKMIDALLKARGQLSTGEK